MTDNKQDLTKLERVDRGLWRLHNLAEIGVEVAMNELVCTGTLSHLLEEIMERCDQLHDLTQELEAEERDRKARAKQRQTDLTSVLMDVGEKMADDAGKEAAL